jgi:hypothetical protein
MFSITIVPDKPQWLDGLLRFFKRVRRYQHLRVIRLVPLAHAEPYAERKNYKLMFIKVRELGFETGAEYADICERAFAIGYTLCPAWVAVQLGLQYLQKEFSFTLKGELHRYKCVYVAMRPLPNCMGSPFAFVLMDAFGTDLLYADYVYPHTRFFPDDTLLFWSP